MKYKDAESIRENNKAVVPQAAENLCKDLGIQEDTYKEHAEELILALLMYRDRNGEAHDAWRQVGYLGNLLTLWGKVVRLMNGLWYNVSGGKGEKPIDNAIDAINYAAFFVRGYRRGEERGERVPRETK